MPRVLPPLRTSTHLGGVHLVQLAPSTVGNYATAAMATLTAQNLALSPSSSGKLSSGISHRVVNSFPASRTNRYPYLFSSGSRIAHPLCTGIHQGNTIQIVAAATEGSTARVEEGSGTGFVASVTKFFRGILRNIGGGPEPESGMEGGGEARSPPQTVLVVGATGRTGRLIVTELLALGFRVVALVASEERAQDVLVTQSGLQLGRNRIGGELVTRVGDITDEESLVSALQGCDAVICAVGSRFGPTGVAPGGAPKDIYSTGIALLAKTAARTFSQKDETAAGPTTLPLLTFPPSDASGVLTSTSAQDNGSPSESVPHGTMPMAEGWMRIDDGIMGGISDSVVRQKEGSAIFEGTIRSEGGGFCSARYPLPEAPLDLSQFDGIRLRVKGDGQRYKLGLKTAVTLVASLFWFNKETNPRMTPGRFSLEIEHVSGYKSFRPQFVLLSSAAVERNARIASEGEREASIPIVKLNPGGILDWKLLGEAEVVSSGLRYAIVRPCGLTDKEEDQSFRMEVAQGDCLTGLLSRKEAALCTVQALLSRDAVNATFEVRRDELTKGLPMTDWTNLFRRLRPDVVPSLVPFPFRLLPQSQIGVDEAR